jgi:GntR family transcriptional repressor for pyruvate dehydrogenase complex
MKSPVSDDLWRRDLPDPSAGEPIPARIAAHIAGLIAEGALAPGTALPSGRELALLLGVSRPAVREAVGRLEALGLVTVRPRAGAFVATRSADAAATDLPARQLPTVVELEDLFDVRRLLEPAAAAWAARRADANEIAQLRRAAARFAEAAAGGSVAETAEADIALHLELAGCAENAVLARLVERLYDPRRMQLEWSLRRRGRAAEAVAEHDRVVDAIAARAAGEAESAMRAHLAAAEDAARETLVGGEETVD